MVVGDSFFAHQSLMGCTDGVRDLLAEFKGKISDQNNRAKGYLKVSFKKGAKYRSKKVSQSEVRSKTLHDVPRVVADVHARTRQFGRIRGSPHVSN